MVRLYHIQVSGPHDHCKPSISATHHRCYPLSLRLQRYLTEGPPRLNGCDLPHLWIVELNIIFELILLICFKMLYVCGGVCLPPSMWMVCGWGMAGVLVVIYFINLAGLWVLVAAEVIISIVHIWRLVEGISVRCRD